MFDDKTGIQKSPDTILLKPFRLVVDSESSLQKADGSGCHAAVRCIKYVCKYNIFLHTVHVYTLCTYIYIVCQISPSFSQNFARNIAELHHPVTGTYLRLWLWTSMQARTWTQTGTTAAQSRSQTTLNK
jgi:hypothetical protein